MHPISFWSGVPGGVGCDCFPFSFAGEISEGSQQSPNIPAPHLVWTNWYRKGGVSNEGEFARAQAMGLANVETVWRAIKESFHQMDVLSTLPLLSQPSTEALEN
jgi:hypothetical protein